MSHKFLEPIKVGSQTVKNRVVFLAMAKTISNFDDGVSVRDIDYIESVAAGGVGIVIPGAMIVDKDWPSVLPLQPGIYDDKFIPGLRRLAAAAHKHGAKIFFQLWHPGATNYSGIQPKTVDELSIDEIRNIQDKFVAAAKRAMAAGADGIEFQTCHGYLACQFISPLFNHRTDEYGWEKVEDRARFATETISRIREAIGPDKIISEGDCDMVGMGRGILAEREWVKKCAEGREDELRYCISCMNCFNVGLFACDQTNCSVNPYALREGAKRPLHKDGASRVVAIVGAGPAGMEAAVTLKQRGFEPVVFDKGSEIGGNLHIAKLPPFKGKFDWAAGYYKSMAAKLGIDVRLNTEATADMIKDLNPYAVFIASGSNAVSIPLPGLDTVPVYQSHDVLVQDMHFENKKIVVLGGGITGLEVALFVRRQGNEVDVVDMLPAWPEAMTDLRFQQEACLETRHCNDQGVGLHYDHKAVKFEDGKLIAESTKDGSALALEADVVIMSVGVKPNDALYNELLAAGMNVYKGGDALATGKINKAVLHGSKFGVTLDE